MVGELSLTTRQIVGYDHYRGEVVRRNVYEDDHGNEYVKTGCYGGGAGGYVPKGKFCSQVLNGEYLTR